MADTTFDFDLGSLSEFGGEVLDGPPEQTPRELDLGSLSQFGGEVVDAPPKQPKAAAPRQIDFSSLGQFGGEIVDAPAAPPAQDYVSSRPGPAAAPLPAGLQPGKRPVSPMEMAGAGMAGGAGVLAPRAEVKLPEAGEFQKGVASGKQSFGGSLSFLGALSGSDTLRKWGETMATATPEQKAKWAPKVEKIQDIKTPGQAVDWLSFNLGNLIPSMGASTAGGVAGGAGGAAVGGPVGAVLGGIGGAGVISYVLNGGEVYANLIEEGATPEQARKAAALAGLPMAILDVIVPVKVAGKLLWQPVKKEAGKQLAKSIGKEVAKDVLEEGLTEGAQEAIGAGTESVVLGRPTLTPENISRVLNAVAAGSLGGVAFGGAGAVGARVRGRVAETAIQNMSDDELLAHARAIEAKPPADYAFQRDLIMREAMRRAPAAAPAAAGPIPSAVPVEPAAPAAAPEPIIVDRSGERMPGFGEAESVEYDQLPAQAPPAAAPTSPEQVPPAVPQQASTTPPVVSSEVVEPPAPGSQVNAEPLPASPVPAQAEDAAGAPAGPAGQPAVAPEAQPAPAAPAAAPAAAPEPVATAPVAQTLYRGAPTAELGKGHFPGTFLSTEPEAAAQYGPVHEFQSTAQNLLDISAGEAQKLSDEYLAKHPDDAPNYEPELDGDGGAPDLWMFPTKGWVKFLKSKGYEGTSMGPDRFIFDEKHLQPGPPQANVQLSASTGQLKQPVESAGVPAAPPGKGVVRPQTADAEPAAAEGASPEAAAPHKYSSTQVDLTPDMSEAVRTFGRKIGDEALAVPDGREQKPHITLKYGLHGNEAAAVAKLLAGEGPIKAKVKALSVFPNVDTEHGKADVLKFEIDSPDLRRLNALLKKNLPNTETHPTYRPHVTVAYLKPGEGKHWAGQAVKGISGQTVTFDAITFSGADGKETSIPLGERFQVVERTTGKTVSKHGTRADAQKAISEIHGGHKTNRYKVEPVERFKPPKPVKPSKPVEKREVAAKSAPQSAETKPPTTETKPAKTETKPPAAEPKPPKSETTTAPAKPVVESTTPAPVKSETSAEEKPAENEQRAVNLLDRLVQRTITPAQELEILNAGEFGDFFEGVLKGDPAYETLAKMNPEAKALVELGRSFLAFAEANPELDPTGPDLLEKWAAHRKADRPAALQSRRDFGGNTALYKGKPFYSGVASTYDGEIEEVHTHEEAEAADWHHSMYVSPEAQERMDDETSAYFWVDNGGGIQTFWGQQASARQNTGIRNRELVDKIKRHIQPLPGKAPLQSRVAGQPRAIPRIPTTVEAHEEFQRAEEGRRGMREMSKYARLQPEEKKIIAAAVEGRKDLSPREARKLQTEIEDTVRGRKAMFPTTGDVRFQPLALKKVAFKEEDGKQKLAIEYQTIPYAFDAPVRGKKLWEVDRLTPKGEEVARRMAAEIANEVRAIRAQAAAAEDKAEADRTPDERTAIRIASQKDWYNQMRKLLRHQFGAAGDIFADLLGATSARTPVATNWKQAVEALELFSKGKYDQALEKYKAFRASGGSPKQYQAAGGQLALRAGGRKFNANTMSVMEALVGLFQGGEGTPKTQQYAGNFVGRTDNATIDVWAARTLQRIRNRVYGDAPAIPSAAEGGVQGNVITMEQQKKDGSWVPMLSTHKQTGPVRTVPPRTTGQFHFGEAVFTYAAEQLGMKPHELQALLWFAEKDWWTQRGITSMVGEGGDMAAEARNENLRRLVVGAAPQDSTVPGNAVEMMKPAAEVAKKEPGVKAVVNSHAVGMWSAPGGDQAGQVEFSAQFEVTLKAGNDAAVDRIAAEVLRAAQANNQDDAFVAKTVTGDELDASYARPGLTIYFKTPLSGEEVWPLIEGVRTDAIGGFTLFGGPGVPAGKYVGMRFIYMPEYVHDTAEIVKLDADEVAEMVRAEKVSAFVEMDSILAGLQNDPRVGHSLIEHFDVLTGYKERYGELIDQLESAAGDASGPQATRASGAGSVGPWRQPIGEAVAARALSRSPAPAEGAGHQGPGGDGQPRPVSRRIEPPPARSKPGESSEEDGPATLQGRRTKADIHATPPEQLTRKQFRNNFVIHFDISEPGRFDTTPKWKGSTPESRAESIMRDGLSHGWVGGDWMRDDRMPGEREAMMEGWAWSSGVAQEGAHAYVFPDSAVDRGNPWVKDGSKPVAHVVLDRREPVHKALVRQALQEGKAVPAEVLKDYPDLAPASLQARRDDGIPPDERSAWVTPEGKVHDLGTEMHEDFLQRKFGDGSGTSLEETYLEKGWLRVRGNTVLVSPATLKAGGVQLDKAMRTALRAGAGNAIIETTYPHTSAWVRSADLGEFLGNPQRYIRRYMRSGPSGLQSRRPMPGFYSGLERAIEAKMPAKASSEQIANIVNNPQNGVKPEELKWTGFGDWLAKQQGPVTKEQALDFIRQNEVRVEEVEFGAAERNPLQWSQEEGEDRVWTSDRGLKIQELGNGRFMAFRPNGGGVLGSAGTLTEAKEIAEKAVDLSPKPSTKYAQYTLPGGSNYRELLLTLPARQAAVTPDGWKVTKIDRERNPYRVVDGDGRLLAYGANEADAINEALLMEGIAPPSTPARYQSGHWNEPNVLAHVRFDDRTGPGAEKILHVAEIQSDWHQEGRRKGYQKRLPNLPPAELVDKYLNLVNVGKQYYYETNKAGDEFLGTAPGYESLAVTGTHHTKEAARAEAEKLVVSLKGAGVPEAPFAKTWHELAFRRVLRHAAENGYDKVTWDTGATSAERYDLSKQVSKIHHAPAGEGKTALWIYGKDGEPVHEDLSDRIEGAEGGTDDYAMDAGSMPVIVPNTQLERLLGKDVAQRILDGKGLVADEQILPENSYQIYATDTGRVVTNGLTLGEAAQQAPVYSRQRGVKHSYRQVGNKPMVRELKGLDLSVGGQGMVGFYDQILPAYAAKYGKKWGASVSRESVNAGNDWRVLDPGSHEYRYFGTEEQLARAFANKVGGTVDPGGKSAQVHAIDITPAMRESVMAGQPLFAKRPALKESPAPAGDIPTVPEIKAYWKAAAAKADTVEGQPVLWVNGSAMDIVLSRMGPTGAGTNSAHTVGLAMQAGEILNVIEEGRAAARHPRPGGFDDALVRIGRQMEQMLGIQPGERLHGRYGVEARINALVVVQAGDAITPEGAQKILEEELDHAKQMRLPHGLNGLPVYILDSPAGERAVEALGALGYKIPDPRSPFYEHNRAIMAAEVGARLMRGGRYAELNLSPEEAVELAAQYIEGLERQHGDRAAAIVEQTKDAIQNYQSTLGRGPQGLGQQPEAGAPGAPEGRREGAAQLPARTQSAGPAPAEARKPAVDLPEGKLPVKVKGDGKVYTAYYKGRVAGKAIMWRENGRPAIFKSVTNPEYRRRGVMAQIYQQIEADLGEPLTPSQTLSDDAFEFWSRYRPQAVEGDLRVHRGQLLGREFTSPHYGPGTITSVGRGAVIVTKPGGTTYGVKRGALEAARMLDAPAPLASRLSRFFNPRERTAPGGGKPAWIADLERQLGAKAPAQAVPETTEPVIEDIPAAPDPPTFQPGRTPMTPVEDASGDREPETRYSTLGFKVNQQALENQLGPGFKEIPEYETMNVAEQARRAKELVEKNLAGAIDIAMGRADAPRGLVPESVFVAVENYATARRDVNLLRDLATKSTASLEATAMGQRIRMLGERNANSPVAAIQKVVDKRKAASEKRHGKNAEKKVKAEIKKEVEKVNKNPKNWADWVESIRCS